MKLNITKGIITREEALALCPDYVKFIEHKANWDAVEAVLHHFEGIKRGQDAVSVIYDGLKTLFVRVKVSSVNSNDMRAVDGPVVRVSNGEYTWRVDGNDYCWTLPGSEACRQAVDAALVTA